MSLPQQKQNPTPPKPPAPAPVSNMSPTMWAQQLLADLGAPITGNTTQDIMAWMEHEEPASQWWGGYGTASAPSRFNPLNAGDIGHYGYHATPLTGNTLSGGLGTYNNLMDAAAASAQMLGQGNMSAIKAALMGNQGLQGFTQALESSPWASSHYGGAGFPASSAVAEAGGPNVTGAQFIGGQVGPVPGAGGGPPSATQKTSAAAGSIASILEAQGLPAAVANQIQAMFQQEQMALGPQAAQDQIAFLTQQYGLSQKQFGVQGAQYALQGKGMQEQLANLRAQYGFQQQSDVLSGQDITRSIQDIVKNYGIQTRQLGLQQTQARAGLASSGVYNTGSRGMEEQQFALQRQGMQVAEQSALFQQSQAQKRLKLTEAEQKQQFGYSQQQIDNGMAQLKLQQQSLGISEQQAQIQYQNAVQQVGLGNVMNGLQLEQQVAAMAGGGYSPLNGIMGQLAQLLPFLGGMAVQNPGIVSGG